MLNSFCLDLSIPQRVLIFTLRFIIGFAFLFFVLKGKGFSGKKTPLNLLFVFLSEAGFFLGHYFTQLITGLSCS